MRRPLNDEERSFFIDTVFADDGRLWIFKSGSKSLQQFQAKGEPAKRVTLIGSGPDGKSGKDLFSVKAQGGDVRMTVSSPGLPWSDYEVGESIAVSGVCLTAVALHAD